eukprot:gene31249-37761_t
MTARELRPVFMAKDTEERGRKQRRRERLLSKDKKPNRTVSPNNDAAAAALATKPQPISAATSSMRPDGSSSLEDMFGLGDEQLKDMMELELPLPREDLVTKTASAPEDKNKVFQLPELAEFIRKVGTVDDMKKKKDQDEADKPKVDRSNRREYLKLIELNPFADADETLFQDEYDIIPSIFGSGKLMNIPVPYLQTGHGILMVVSLLAAFVYAPGNPLTEFPPEIRTFLQNGLLAVYSINLVLAVQAAFKAKAKHLPVAFWAMKTLLLGGIAFYELGQTKDPTKVL